MDDIHSILNLLLKASAFITAIGAAWAYIKKWHNESKSAHNSELIQELKEKVDDNDRRLKDLEKDKKKSNSYINAMCGAMLALLDHNINGNSIDKLKEAKEEMKEFLIHRG